MRKKWPKCCPSNGISSSVKLNSQTRAQTYIKESLNEFDQSQRIENLEKAIKVLKAQLDVDAPNRTASQEVMKLKEDLNSILEKLMNGNPPLYVDFLKSIDASGDCETNIKETSSVDEMSCNEVSEEDSNFKTVNEVKWLKEQMFELSESMRLHTKCLKQLKIDDFGQLKMRSDELARVVQSLKCQLMERRKTTTGDQNQNDVVIGTELENMKAQITQLNSQLKSIDKKLESAKMDARQQIGLLRSNLQSQTGERTCTSTSYDSTVPIKIKNLMKSDDDDCTINSVRRTKNFMEKVGCTSVSSSACPSYQSTPMCQPASSESLEVHPESSETLNRSGTQSESICSQSPDRRSESSNYDKTLSIIQKQVSSHNFCLQQLIRDLEMKLDRDEFELSRRQLQQLCSIVMTMRKTKGCPTTAAGAVIPLMRNINCISCQKTTNMRMTTESVPFTPALKFGRTCATMINQPRLGSQDNGSLRSRRRVGGSKTALSKAMQVCAMRFKRLNTPKKIVSSLYVCKNRFRRGPY